MHVVVEKYGYVYFRTNQLTLRPAETRMGSGKGSPEYWVAVVKPGRILYEMGGVTENIAEGLFH
ncbi:hypothetical protein H5410_064197 [Solanum commersonii]|uniref:Ribosomal protein L10e/L16 domain-containing protein n=1 Tax=Solanum commersonii TaxID=4109 RepID=A0A9J5W039_SOLCO|nr:hypothetical protein H5410_064197 [Solanum commersonii]